VITALVAAGLAAGLFYGHIQLGREQQAHQNKINEMNRKVSMLGKKASEEREALSGAEGRNRTLQADLDRLRKENGEQAEEMKKALAEGQSLEAKLKEMTEEAARMKADRIEVSAQLAQILQAARDLEGQAKLLAAGKQTLEASLAKVNQDLDTCKNHNARLCLIADEILTKQKAGSTLGGMLRGEPVTQIGKVELEKFMQEYKDKIDQEKVRN
jgi:chromosome segregation ATPase